MDNPYLKLEEANRIYLNPTLDLVVNDANLAEHCYYLIKKWPAHGDAFWTYLVQHEWDQLLALDQITDKKNKPDPTILANVKLAHAKDDRAYLDFMLTHRPQNKMTLNLSRKKPVISDELVKAMEIDEVEPGKITAIALKQILNRYILKHKLQSKQGGMIKLDHVLRELLKYEADDPTDALHFFKVHRRFNQKYFVNSTT